MTLHLFLNVIFRTDTDKGLLLLLFVYYSFYLGFWLLFCHLSINCEVIVTVCIVFSYDISHVQSQFHLFFDFEVFLLILTVHIQATVFAYVKLCMLHQVQFRITFRELNLQMSNSFELESSKESIVEIQLLYKSTLLTVSHE